MSKAKKRLKNFDFSGENAHVALVHREQGGPANGTNTLIMKSTDVVVELSMAEFLVRFFNIWSGDAMFIAEMLGYSDDIESLYDNDELMSKVKLLASAKSENKDLSELNQEQLREVTKSLAAASNVKLIDLDVIKNTNGVSNSPISENEETPDEVKKNMSGKDNTEMVEKSVVTAMVEKAVADALASKDSHIEELQKSLKDFEDQKVEAKQKEFVAKAEGFAVLGVEDAESFGLVLMKMSEQEGFDKLEAVLEKAVNIAKNADGFKEVGHDADVEDHQSNGVEAVLKSRGSIRS